MVGSAVLLQEIDDSIHEIPHTCNSSPAFCIWTVYMGWRSATRPVHNQDNAQCDTVHNSEY